MDSIFASLTVKNAQQTWIWFFASLKKLKKQGMTVTRHRRWNNRGHRNRATVTVTVKIFLSGGDGDGENFFVRRWRWRWIFFCPAVTVTVISFVVRGDGDGYGDFYSPVLTVMGRNILIIVERGQKNVGEKITHQSAFLVDTVTN